MSHPSKLAAAVVLLGSAVAAQATGLFTNAGFGPGSSTVNFGEVALSAGTSVSNQFAPFGVTFTTDTGSGLYSSGPSNTYRNIANFSGAYLDTFSGGGAANTYGIHFAGPVTAAGAFWEFNVSSPAATFSAYLGGALVESFAYNNTSCCSSAEFVGFSNAGFDEIRVSGITGRHFIVDNLQFNNPTAVPEPATWALFGMGAMVAGLSRRRQRKA